MSVIMQVQDLITTVVIAAVIVALIIGSGVLIFVMYQRKKHAEGHFDESEARLNYNNFRREDAQEYVKFDDIIDFGWGGSIVVDNGTRFVAGLVVTGYDYAMASAEERLRSVNGMQTVANAISWPVQVHQDSRRADLSTYIERCEGRIEGMKKAIGAYRSEMQTIKASINLLNDSWDEENRESREYRDTMRYYTDRMRDLGGEITAMQNLIQEQEAQIWDMERFSENYSPVKNHKYMVDWIYRPQEYSTRHLEKPEIISEAKKNLKTRLDNLASAISSTGVSTHIMTADELLTAEYVHYHPLSAGEFRIDEIRESSYFYPYTNGDISEVLEKVEQERELVRKYRETYEQDVMARARIEYLERESERERELARQEKAARQEAERTTRESRKKGKEDGKRT